MRVFLLVAVVEQHAQLCSSFSLTVNAACPLALTFFESMIVNGCVILTKVVISSVCS